MTDTLDTMRCTLEWMLYAPHAHRRAPFTAYLCAAAVSEGGQSVTFRQCARRPTIRIGGYGWCIQHATMLHRRAAYVTPD